MTFEEFLVERALSTKQVKLVDSEELTQAVEKNDYDKVRELLEKGHNPDYRNPNNWTPMGLASRQGSEKILKLLLKHGADVNGLAGSADATPLQLCLTNFGNSTQLAELLIKHGADINIPNRHGWYPIESASRDNDVETLNVMLKHNPNKDSLKLALEQAERFDSKDTAKILKELV